MYGQLVCLAFCIAQGCPCSSRTAAVAAMAGHKAIVTYIFDNYMDLHSWKDSQLELYMCEYSKEMKEYIESIEDEWKWHANRSENIKG
jgi:hypothetical protein